MLQMAKFLLLPELRVMPDVSDMIQTKNIYANYFCLFFKFC